MTLSTQLMLPTEGELKSYNIVATVASQNPYWRKVGGNGTNEQIVATILSVMLLARELGISPIQAISGGINNVNGKFEISARIMNQLIRKHGHRIQVKISTDEICVIWSKRKDTGEEHTSEYQIQEAARAGLIKDGGGWKKCPKDMLFARSISRLARQLYPDCIGGCYVEGELQETMQGKVVSEIEIPNLEEVNTESVTSHEPIVLELPENLIHERVNQFIQETALQNKKSIEDVKIRAQSNLNGFIEIFRLWEAKNFPQSDSEDACLS